MDRQKLEKILLNHSLWLTDNNDGKRANLYKTSLPLYKICPMVGSFVAYKKAKIGYHSVIVKLLITEDALRTSNLIGRKQRCNKAKVLEFLDLSGNSGVIHSTKAYSNYDKNFVYELGKLVECSEYNDDIRVDCTTGIHFFMTFEEAKNW